MRQRQVIKEVSEGSGLKQTDAKQIIDETISQMQRLILGQQKVDIPDFGALSLVRYKEKNAQIPGKEGTVFIPSHLKLQFKQHDILKNALQELPYESE